VFWVCNFLTHIRGILLLILHFETSITAFVSWMSKLWGKREIFDTIHLRAGEGVVVNISLKSLTLLFSRGKLNPSVWEIVWKEREDRKNHDLGGERSVGDVPVEERNLPSNSWVLLAYYTYRSADE
jgi:hypothetical protein